jgi:hypothetical protein
LSIHRRILSLWSAIVRVQKSPHVDVGFKSA